MRNSQQRVLLCEILICTLFLSMCCALGLKFFAYSKKRAEDSVCLSHAVQLCENAAELYKLSVSDEDFCVLIGAQPLSKQDNGSIKVLYDSKFNKSGSENAAYELSAVIYKGKNDSKKAKISFFDGEKEVFALEVTKPKEERR